MNSTNQLTVGVTGATGLVGRSLCEALRQSGHRVIPFTRDPSRFSALAVRRFDTASVPDFSGIDAVIHLAGEPILGVWNEKKKRKILESRVLGTRRVVEGIDAAGCVHTFLCASAIGYYGFRGDEELPETAGSGTGFLAGVCKAWEAEAVGGESPSTRVCRLRIGMVLGHGGASAVMLRAFKLGLGGRLGNGNQWMAPIHNHDLSRIFLFLLDHPELSGAFNASMPVPVTNREFTAGVAEVLSRPAVIPVPAFALKMALGGLSELLLGSLRVVPRRLLDAGFVFEYPTVREAFVQIAGKAPAEPAA